MRRFQTTPQKKLIGMVILFVFIPLFLLWYVVFFLDNRPDEITLTLIACIGLLAAYFYWKYRKKAAGSPVSGEEETFEGEAGEDFEEDAEEGLEGENEEEPEGEFEDETEERPEK